MTKFPSAKTSCAVVLAGGLLALAQPASAVFLDPANPALTIPTQLLSFGPIQGDVFLPLTNAANSSTEPGAPAAVDGYGWVDSHVTITLSSQRSPAAGPPSLGQATLGVPFSGGAAGGVAPGCQGHGQAGNVSTGDSVCVNSFFDVWFDVTISNQDTSGAKFFGNAGAPQTISQIDNQTPSPLQQNSTCIADTSKPNLGCLPPAGSAYIGHFQVKVELGLDINGNGANDKLKFDFVQHDVGGVTNTFLSGANLVDTFNSTIQNTGGMVGDALSDPPFGSFVLAGPTTASQGIIFAAESAALPEPASLSLLAAGLGIMPGFRRRSLEKTA